MALRVVTVMQRGRVVELNAELAMDAAKTSWKTKLPIADSVILATARTHDAAVWTQDSDFKGLTDVEYVKKG